MKKMPLTLKSTRIFRTKKVTLLSKQTNFWAFKACNQKEGRCCWWVPYPQALAEREAWEKVVCSLCHLNIILFFFVWAHRHPSKLQLYLLRFPSMTCLLTWICLSEGITSSKTYLKHSLWSFHSQPCGFWWYGDMYYLCKFSIENLVNRQGLQPNPLGL